jgi:hypothetical protein
MAQARAEEAPFRFRRSARASDADRRDPKSVPDVGRGRATSFFRTVRETSFGFDDEAVWSAFFSIVALDNVFFFFFFFTGKREPLLFDEAVILRVDFFFVNDVLLDLDTSEVVFNRDPSFFDTVFVRLVLPGA